MRFCRHIPVLWGNQLPLSSMLFCPENEGIRFLWNVGTETLHLWNVETSENIFSLHGLWIFIEQYQSSFSYLLQSAQAELAVIKTELDFLKSNPQPDGQKGNSLFAEVEDKRLNMKKRLDAVLQKYHHVKKNYKDKCAELGRVNVCSPNCILLLWYK